jgi:thiamine-phosphate pyrophosphorylase
MMWPNLNSRIYFITPAGIETKELLALVEAAVAGGAGMVQYREKSKSTRRMIADVHSMLQRCRPAGVPVIVNDRVDVALAAGADGVHLGVDDMPIDMARGVLGAEPIIGATTPTMELVKAAEAQGASYVAIGAIFDSPTKPEKAAVGLGVIARAKAATRLPVCAIGGINGDNIALIAEERIALYAVISAISDAVDPRVATTELVRLSRAVNG